MASLVTIVSVGGPAEGESFQRGMIDPTWDPVVGGKARWQEIVEVFASAGAQADQRYVAADAASALSYEVRRAGWSSPDVPARVNALLATANPDGGFGLAMAWDAFQDGTVNSATTSYTATTAGHVGPILLAGYRAGAVPAAAVNRALDSILNLPKAPGIGCIPYSNSPNDLATPCVWNTYFGAAAWVKRAGAATGHRPGDVAALVATATSVLATLTPDPDSGYLPYTSAQTLPQDLGHQLWTATSIDYLRGNRAARTEMLSKPLWRLQAVRAHDYNAASALGAIALFDCQYATDPFVLAYAASTSRGNPYAYKALAGQARDVLKYCFASSGSGHAAVHNPLELALPELG